MKYTSHLLSRTIKQHRSSILTWSLLFILTFLFVTSATSIPTTAQTDTRDTAGYVYVEKYTDATFTTYNDLITGTPESSLSEGEEGKEGAMPIVLGLADELYNQPPASGIIWAQHEVSKLKGLNSVPVHAQADPNDITLYFPGTGYTILKPVNTLWQWSRNIVYFVFIIILVAIAFLVLFRKNLGGQVTVTISNSLPSIMWSLLLVTLSYPISGFAVDLVYIGSGLVQSMLISGPGAPGIEFVNTSKIYNETGRKDINYLQPDDPQISIWGIWDASSADLCKNDDCQTSSLLPDIKDNSILKSVGKIISSIGSTDMSISATKDNPLLILVLSLAAFQASLKLFLALLKEYTKLILLPILSPFIFLTAAFPNRTSGAISNFLKTMGKASLSFIAVYALFLFMIVLGQSHNFEGVYGSIADLEMAPPLLGYSPDQLVGEDSVIRTILIFMLFMMAPSIPDLIGSFFDVKPANEYISKVGRNTTDAFKKSTTLVTNIISGLRNIRKK